MKKFNSWPMWLGLATLVVVSEYRQLRLENQHEAELRSVNMRYSEHLRRDSLEIERVNERLRNAGLFHKGIHIQNNHKSMDNRRNIVFPRKHKKNS